MSDNFIQEKKFFDDVNYPYGFSRSGDYTVKESRCLEDFGTRLSKLMKGEVKPTNDTETHFVEVCLGEVLPDSFIEKTWLKYNRLITEVKRVFVLADDGTSLISNDEND